MATKTSVLGLIPSSFTYLRSAKARFPLQKVKQDKTLNMCLTLLHRLGDNCVESHSPEELEEWKLRWEERHQAEDPEDQTYSDKILHEVLGFSPQER